MISIIFKYSFNVISIPYDLLNVNNLMLVSSQSYFYLYIWRKNISDEIDLNEELRHDIRTMGRMRVHERKMWVSICYLNHIKRCSVSLSVQLFVWGLMSYLRYLCLIAHSGVKRILCCVFVLFFFILLFMLPVSLDCPILIAPSVFSNVYWISIYYLSLYR